MSMFFFALSIINFSLMIALVVIGIRMLAKPTSPLNGWESLVVVVLIMVSVFFAFNSGVEADQSHRHLEYTSVQNAKADRNIIVQNQYTYYPLPLVLTNMFIALSLTGAYVFYNFLREKQRYKKVMKRINSEEHQQWQTTIQNSLNSKR